MHRVAHQGVEQGYFVTRGAKFAVNGDLFPILRGGIGLQSRPIRFKAPSPPVGKNCHDLTLSNGFLHGFPEGHIEDFAMKLVEEGSDVCPSDEKLGEFFREDVVWPDGVPDFS